MLLLRHMCVLLLTQNGASSRRHVYQSSALPSCSLGGLELEEKGAESDEESVVAESAAARKLRRERWVFKQCAFKERKQVVAYVNTATQ